MLMTGCNISAQSKFTEHIKSQQAGEGKILIIQTSEIDDAVNNTPPPPVKKRSTEVASKTYEQRAHESIKKNNNGTKLKDKTPHNNHTTDNNNENTYEGYHTSGIARQRYKATGFRIQIFTGSNSHNDKMKAYSIGEACQKKFPMLSIYPRFINPRWICRVGDFRTHEDALEYARKIRMSRISKEVRIVRCEVLLVK